MLGLCVLMGQDGATAVLRPALAALLVLNAVPLALLTEELRPVLAQRHSPGRLRGLGVFCLGTAVVLPLCLVLIGGAFLLAAVVSLLLGSLVVRHVIVGVPQVPHGH